MRCLIYSKQPANKDAEKFSVSWGRRSAVLGDWEGGDADSFMKAIENSDGVYCGTAGSVGTVGWEE